MGSARPGTADVPLEDPLRTHLLLIDGLSQSCSTGA
jgi:hypothetical protein